MKNFGKTIVKFRIPIIILSLLLIFPSVIGMVHTRINYDMLTYLPKDIETVKGQDMLLKEFGKGAFSFIVIDGMEDKDVAALKDKISDIDHVDSCIWYNSLADLSVPKEILPKKLYNEFNSEDSTMLAVFFDSSVSSDETMDAIGKIRSVTTKDCYVTGMSAMVTDLKELCEKEEPIYVAIAVILACFIMMIFLDNFLIPLIFLASIGIAILINLGSNVVFGEISYITKALSAVLQLAVTMDYSIFLWHSYEEQKTLFNNKQEAMAEAINKTLVSIVGSSLTTVVGFIALCFMSFTLGKDLGIVMAKGVVFGVIGCVTTLPSLILVLEKPVSKASHKAIIPDMKKISGFIVKKSWIFIIIFLLLAFPAYYGYAKTNSDVYFDLSKGLPKDMPFNIANEKLNKTFKVGTTHMILVDADTPSRDVRLMSIEMEKVKGVKYVLGMENILGSMLPEDLVPKDLKEIIKTDKWELMLINSQYSTASDEVNDQIDSLNTILKKYDQGGMVIGEASCTKDMLEITNKDFQVVSAISIAAIFVIIALVLKSISLPFILVLVIEFAIFVNIGLSSYCGTSLPFIAPICISTIQLGATVDYAILMTTRYKTERIDGQSKQNAIITALSTSIPSIIVSALGFFAATYGVALYSDIDIISSLCLLMARGAIISMFCVILILPAMLKLFDKLVCKSTAGMKLIK